MKRISWEKERLEQLVKDSYSIRQVIIGLGLVAAGGNYAQVKKYITIYKLDTKHFLGMGWSKGKQGNDHPRIPTKDILVLGSTFQSYKLKQRLFKEGLKSPHCEECGWAKKSEDGRLPLELDHINGNPQDNRIENLRILCPNCHSLKPTHRGKNKKIALVAKWYTRDT